MATSDIYDLLNVAEYPLNDSQFRARCRSQLDTHGVLVLANFLTPKAIDTVRAEGEKSAHLAYYTANSHNAYLAPHDPSFTDQHARNQLVSSSKGCITTDQIAENSPLSALYNSEEFKAFLAAALNESELHEYADPLSSINLHYASEGQELGWHYDNSSFAITLLIQKPTGGGVFEYVKNVRDADANHMAYDDTSDILNGKKKPSVLAMEEGALVLFRGRNSIHRVTPTEGDVTRMLVVLAYNNQAGVSLSESARMTFYGRLS